MKKIISLIITTALLFAVNPTIYAETVKNGECGDNLKWEYVYDIAEEYQGTLTISGTGDMTDYNQFNESLWYKSNFTDSIDRLVIDKGVTSVGNYTFWGKDLGSLVTLSDSVKRIGNAAFGNTNIDFVELNEGLETIGEYAFGASELKEIIIPNSVNSISNDAFLNSYIEKASLGNGISRIENETFYNCTRLSDINIPESVNYIGNYSFAKTGVKDIIIPDSVKYIGKGAFSNSDITSIKLSKNITRIEDNTFSNCANLSEIVIPNTVKYIGKEAFKDCKKLATIRIPKSVDCIDRDAFSGCPDSMLIYYTGSDEQWSKLPIASSNNAILTANVKTNSLIITKPDIDTISALDNQEFSIEVTEPQPGGRLWLMLSDESLSYIDDSGITVLDSDEKKKTITKQNANEYVEISDGAVLTFKTAYKFGVITLNYKYTYNELDGTEHSYNIKKDIEVSIGLSGGGTSFGGGGGTGGGGGYSGYQEPLNPEGNEMFEVEVTENWDAESRIAVEAWNRVESAVISSKVTNIKPYAFSYLKNMTKVTIPVSITEIGFGAFGDTESLTDIYYKGSEEEWNTILICENNSCLSNAEIHFSKETSPSTHITMSSINIERLSDEELSFSVSVDKVYDDAYVYAATYYSKNSLNALNKVPLRTVGPTVIDVDKSSNDSYVKIYVWNYNMQAITESKKFDI